MAVTDEYLQFVLEQLQGLGGVAPRRMFGGVGLYHDDRFFAIITRDTMYFKVNDGNRGDYEARGKDRFRPYPNKPHWSMTYYEVPADILEDSYECVAWARRSIAIASMPSKPSKPATRRGKKRARRRPTA